jgi:hypothetical protein
MTLFSKWHRYHTTEVCAVARLDFNQQPHGQISLNSHRAFRTPRVQESLSIINPDLMVSEWNNCCLARTAADLTAYVWSTSAPDFAEARRGVCCGYSKAVRCPYLLGLVTLFCKAPITRISQARLEGIHGWHLVPVASVATPRFAYLAEHDGHETPGVKLSSQPRCKTIAAHAFRSRVGQRPRSAIREVDEG